MSRHAPWFVALALILPALAYADAGDQIWRFQGIEDINAMATLPDVDGDGSPDIVVETYDAGAAGDHLYLLSGGMGDPPPVIWSARPSSGVSDGGGDGDNCLEVCGDLSGDGFPDVLLGTAWGNRSVHAIDGRTGALLWTFDSYDTPASGWVYDVSAVPDIDGDGLPEVACALGSDSNSGYLLSGADGVPLWRFYHPLDAVYMAVALPDVNGDDAADVLFCAGDNDHSVYCASGVGVNGVGTQLWVRDTGASNYAATLVDDVNGDGVDDVVIGNWGQSAQVRCYSGREGNLLWTFDNGSFQYIMRLVTLDDVNGDGVRDVAIGSWDRAVRVVSGADGALIWQSWAGTLNGGDFWAVDRVDDVTGDGVNEVIGGSFDTKVYLFNGADGDTLWIFAAGARLFSVRGTDDLNGGGPDVLAGTQYLTSGGWAYAIEGGVDLTAVPPAVAVDGRALRSQDGPVRLRWESSEPLPFNVYRLLPAPEAAQGRAALAQRFREGGISQRELVAAVKSEPETSPQPLNPEPLEPSAENGSWRYAFDDAAPAGGARYELYGLTADGAEFLLLTLEPEDLAPALIQSASLAPNPFNPRCTLDFTLGAPASVSLAAYDVHGRRVATLPARDLPAGAQSLRWDAQGDDGRALAAGVYLLRLSAGDEHRTLRAVLLK